MIDPNLKQWATTLQAKYIDAVNQYGSQGKAAAALKKDPAGINRAIQAVRRKASAAGYSPEHDYNHPVPDGFKLKGASLYYPPTEESPGGGSSLKLTRKNKKTSSGKQLSPLLTT